MSKLGNYISVQNGYAFKSKDFIKNLSGMPVIKIGNVTGGSFIDLSSYDTISEEIARKVKSFQTKDDDILIAMTGANVGKVSRIAKGTQPCLINQRVGRFILKEDCPYSSDFIYYLVSSNKSFQYFSNTADGAAQPNISGKLIEDLEFPDISPKSANKAGKHLKVLDEKIQLNTQINQTLEQIAQALFKSWFVDFDPVRAKVQALSDGLSLEQAELAAMQAISGKTPEELTALSQTQPDRYAELAETAKAFPCEMVEVDGVEVPKGWEHKSVGDFINVVDYVANGSFATLKENVTLLNEPDYAIYIRTTDFNSGFSKELRYVDKPAYDFLAKSVLIGNEVIISNVGDVGTVFRSPSWLGMPMTLGSNAIALKNYDIPHYLYLYFSSHKGQHDISSIVTGSAQLKFNKTNFRSLKVLMPNNSLLTKFENFLLPIFEKIDANMAENLKLAEIRDLLLPRLLSGEI